MTHEQINELLEDNAEWIRKQGDISSVTTHILETLSKCVEALRPTLTFKKRYLDDYRGKPIVNDDDDSIVKK